MTAMPEAALARELDIDYAICAVAVNHAAGRAPDGAAIAGQIERSPARGCTRSRAVLARLAAASSGRSVMRFIDVCRAASSNIIEWKPAGTHAASDP